MEFLEYVKQRNRMFDSIGRKDAVCCGVDCDKCQDLTKESTCFEYLERSNPKQTESIVQKWADEHPVITNAMKFKEVFGYDIGSSKPCPPPSVRKYECEDIKCSECGKWWSEEYREPEKEVKE